MLLIDNITKGGQIWEGGVDKFGGWVVKIISWILETFLNI